MTKCFLTIASFLVLLPAWGASNPPAAITFRDYPVGATTPSDEIHSDYAGTYDSVNGASAYFVSNGNVVLDLRSSTRTIYLDFSTPNTTLNQSLGLNPPNLSGSYRAYVSKRARNRASG